MSLPDERDGSWTLLTGHGHVLVEIARNPGARIRDISAVVGLTERTVQAIVADLAAAGYLTRARTGRRTLYTVNPDSLFRHTAQEGHRVARSSPCWQSPAIPPHPGRPPTPASSPRRRLTRTALDPVPQAPGAPADLAAVARSLAPNRKSAQANT
jgi:MarR family